MYQINEDNSIYVTRGDVVAFSVTAESNGTAYIFHPNDIVRISVYAKKNAENVVLCKDFVVAEETEKVDIFLTENDTKLGEVISKPVEYWYEIELNPLTNPQTIIGYDDDGAKVFKLFPEGDNSGEITEDDIPVVDNDFSTESERPLQNAVITMRFKELQNAVDDVAEKITSKDVVTVTRDKWNELESKGTWEENTLYAIKSESGEGGNAGTDEEIEAIRELVEEANAKANHSVELSIEALAEAQASAKTITYQVSIPNTLWTEDAVSGGYFCNVTVLGMLSTDNPIADVILGVDTDANLLYINSWSMVSRIVTNNDAITLYSHKGVPTTAFTIQLKVVR
jgi:hypothetical protein